VHRIELLEGVAAAPREEWNALVGDGSPFLEWDWLASLEDAGCVGPGTGWQPRPLVAWREGRLVAACPLYVKSHSEGEFVFDFSWAEAAERAGIRYYPKLLVGVPFTPVTGRRFLVAPGEDRAEWIPRLAEALRQVCLRDELSGVHVNFCRPEEAEPLAASGFLLRVGLQYHWHNHGYLSFDDYLARFRSKRRNQIRRERRALAEQGVEVKTLVGDAIDDALFAPIYDCYVENVDAHAWGRRYLNRDFFELLRERFRRRLCFVVARCGGEVLAGTLNVVKGDAFYGRYWGALRPLRHLHFNVCYYAGVEHCIEHGLARFEPGAGGDYKWLRGFDAAPTYSLHFLADPRLAHAVSRFLSEERERAHDVIDELGRQSPLRKQPPAGTPRRPR
jgi:predicted N-acyltransferase